MAWTANYTVSAGETSTGLIVGSNGIPDAVASNMIVYGVANDFVVSHGGILRASAGAETNNAQIVGTAQAQEIIEHTGVANDTVVNNAAGYMWQRGSSYRAVVSKGHQSLVGADARSWDTVVVGGEQRVSAAGAIAYGTIIRAGVQSVYSGTFASDTVISGGSMRVYAGGTVNNVTIMVGNGNNAVLRPEADGITFSGNITMDLSTAITVTTTANYFISSVSRVAANAGVTDTVKVAELDQLSGNYCGGGGATNITATVVTDTGKNLGTITGGAGNPAYTHTAYGALRFYRDTYMYLGVVGDPVAVYNGTTVVDSGTSLEDYTLAAGNSGYIYAAGSGLRTIASGALRVYGETTGTTVVGTGVEIVSSGGVTHNTLIQANSQYVYAGGSALDTVARGGYLQLAEAESYASNVTIYGGTGRLLLSVNGARIDGNINVDVSEIAADNTSGTTFINSLSRVLGYTPHGVTFTVTVAETGQRTGNYYYAGNLSNFTATVVTDGGKTLGTITAKNNANGSWLHTQYGSYRFYNDTYVMLGVVDGHPVEIWDGNTLEAGGDTMSDITIDSGKELFVYDGGTVNNLTVASANAGKINVRTGGTLNNAAIDGNGATANVIVWEGGVANSTTLAAGGATTNILRLSGGVANDTVVSDGQELLYDDAVANRTIVRGGAQKLLRAGAKSYDTVLSAGSQDITADTEAYDTVVSTGWQNVAVGGKAIRTVVRGGAMRVSGMTTSTTISAGQEIVEAGGVASSTVISAGSQIVRGTVYDTIVYGGSQDVNNAAAEAYRTVVSNNGIVKVSAGKAISTLLLGEAGQKPQQIVEAGAIVEDTVVDAVSGYQWQRGSSLRTIVRRGSESLVGASAVASGTIVSGGFQLVSAAGAKAYDTVLSAGEQQVFVGASAERTVAEGGIVRVYGSTTSTTLRGAAQELLYSNTTVANSTTVSGGAQKVLVAGAVASDTVIYGGYQQVAAGASAWNTTIVAGGNGFVNLAENAVTGGTFTWDLSQGAQASTAMLNAWRITDGTDLVITVAADGQRAGKYYLSGGANYFGDTTFTVKDTGDNVIASDFGNGDSVTVGDYTYSLDLVGSGLYFTVRAYPVEIYTGDELTGFGTTVDNAEILPGMKAYVYDGGTMNSATITAVGQNQVLVNDGGTMNDTVVAGEGLMTDIRVYTGGTASNTNLTDATAVLRLSGGTGYDTTVVGGQILMYAGAVASGAVLSDEGAQKLLAPGAVASDTIVSSGGWMQIGATLEQYTSNGYTAGGDAYDISILSGGLIYVEGSATATGVRVYEGGSAYVYSGGQIAFDSVASGGRVNVRFSGATGNENALVTDWGTVEAGAEISIKEVGGAGTYKIADSVNAGFTVNYDEFDVFGGRDINVGQNFSDAFRALNFVLGTTGTLTVTDLTIGTQATAATLNDSNATTLTDGALATTWTANTDLSTIPVVAGANTNADAWLTLDGTTVNGALYGADGNFANDVNLKFRDGSITNLAAGATAGGSVANVNVMIGDIDPEWTTVSHGTTFNGVAYAGGFGSVAGTAGTVLNDGTFKKDFYAGALANRLDAATSVGEVSMRIFGGTFSGNVYGASAVKTVAGKNGLRHSVGDVTLTVAGGDAKKSDFCLFAGGYATGDATGTVYTVESVTLDISDGTWGTAHGGRGIFGGIMASGVAAEVTGDVNITISGGSMGNVYGGGWAQKGGTSIVGNVNITIAGTAEVANVFGGGSTSTTQASGNGSTVAGDVTITVSGGTITGAIYAKGQGVNDSVDSAAVIFSGAKAYTCGVYGYSYVGGEASDATLSFSSYTGTFAGAIGGFNSVTFDGITAMTLTAAAEDVSNGAWTFDVAERRAAFADTAMLNWTAADFAGDTITLNLATGDTNEWSLVGAATDTVYNLFDVQVDGTDIATDLALDAAISGGAYDGWGFTNDEGTLKFKQLA